MALARGTVALCPQFLPKLPYYRTPKDFRDWLNSTGKSTFTAFSTRNICHLGHEYLHAIALELSDLVGVNVITGAQVKGSFLPDVIFDTYDYLIESYYPQGRVFLHNFRLPSFMPLRGGLFAGHHVAEHGVHSFYRGTRSRGNRELLSALWLTSDFFGKD